MQKYFSNSKYISTTGDRFLYEDKTRLILVQCSLSENINVGFFGDTAKAMMKRCPYFHVKKGINNGLYCLMQTDEDVPVIENDGFVHPSDERNKGFLLTFAHGKNTMYFCFHHALTDAHGAVRFAKSFVAEYLRKSTGKNLKIPEDLNPAESPKAEEFENPYNRLLHREHPFYLKSKDGFSLPEEDICENSRCLRISVPSDCFLKLSKNAESTFASVIVMIVSNAMNRVYPNHDKPIKIYCPVDMRTMLGCFETLRHCCYGMNFVFEKKLLSMPLNRQLSCLKGMLLLRTSEEYLIDKMEKRRANHEKVCSPENSIDDIKKTYNTVQYSTPMVSYLKTIDFGDILPYINDFDINVPPHGNSGIVVYSYCIGEKCILNFHTNLKSDDIFKEFLSTLRDLSIPYSIIEKGKTYF